MPEVASTFRYAIAVGANLGERAAAIASAADMLDASGLARVVRRSRLIETAAIGGPAQPAYLNGAWLATSSLGPHQLLHLLQAIETRLGRTRVVPCGPRTIDLDLLLRDDGLIIATPVLRLPHPRLAERGFVLMPLAEIAGDWIHPERKRTIADLAHDPDRAR